MYVDKLKDMLMDASQELGRFMTIEEAAGFMNCSKRTIHNYLAKGELDKIRTGGRTFILVSSIIAKGLKEKIIRKDDIRDTDLKKETLHHLRTKVVEKDSE
jgi:excisionase family DNA binding protein